MVVNELTICELPNLKTRHYWNLSHEIYWERGSGVWKLIAMSNISFDPKSLRFKFNYAFNPNRFLFSTLQWLHWNLCIEINQKEDMLPSFANHNPSKMTLIKTTLNKTMMSHMKDEWWMKWFSTGDWGAIMWTDKQYGKLNVSLYFENAKSQRNNMKIHQVKNGKVRRDSLLLL